jgi:hypothetical protein
MYPSAAGVNGNGHVEWPDYFSERLVTKLLARTGYDCGLVGKLHLAGAAQGQETESTTDLASANTAMPPRGPMMRAMTMPTGCACRGRIRRRC